MFRNSTNERLGRLRAQRSEQVPERPEVEVEVLVAQPEMLFQLVHPLCELHEGLAEPLDLVVVERAQLHPSQRLAFHQLAEELDQSEDELRKPSLDRFRIG